MTIVVDASVIVAGLLDTGPDGRWAEDLLASEPLTAPHLMPAEVANVLRRLSASGVVTVDVAGLALADLGDLRLSLVPFHPFAGRVWELRENLSSYDAWYVALAETLDARMATLDRSLARAPGLRCSFVTPAGGS